MLIAFHKPYGVLSQFTPEAGSAWRTLAEFGFPPGVYPIGRLDADSEGLLLLSDEPDAQRAPAASRACSPATILGAGRTRARPSRRCADFGTRRRDPGPPHAAVPRVRLLDPPPDLPPRDPPIRVRKNVPDCWIALELTEGKNRQVRRMTAAVGHPTLRLVRVRVGDYELGTLQAGHWTALGPEDRRKVLLARPRGPGPA